jgi:hypothetical protein
MRTEVWKGTTISWFILRIFLETPVGDLIPFRLSENVVTELLMQIPGTIGICQTTSTGTTTMTTIREMDLVGSIPSTKVCRVPRLLLPFLVLIDALVDIRADSLLEMIKFFAALILNTDEATDL